jgi:hypothetical protein
MADLRDQLIETEPIRVDLRAGAQAYYWCCDVIHPYFSKATGCALEPNATKDRGSAANHGSHNPSDYRGWSENTFKSYDTNP